MLALLYIPLFLYDILRTYFIPHNDNDKPRKRIISKYSSSQKKCHENSSTDNQEILYSKTSDHEYDGLEPVGELDIVGESTLAPLSKQLSGISKDEALLISTNEVSSNFKSASELASESSGCNIVAESSNIPCLAAVQISEPANLISLEDSDESDFEDYLNEIVSVIPSARLPNHASSQVSNHASSQVSNHASSQVSNHASSQVFNHASSQVFNHASSQVSNHTSSQVSNHASSQVSNDASSQVSNHASSQVSNHASSQSFETSVRENDHVIVLDGPVYHKTKLTVETCDKIPPNSFLPILSDLQGNSVNPISDILPYDCPTEMCQSNNHAIVDSNASSIASCDRVPDDTGSDVTNQVLGNYHVTNQIVRDPAISAVGVNDDPMQPTSLTSQKNAPITKYVPKEQQKRKRSDLEWSQYMEKCMVAGDRSKIINSFGECFKEAFDTYRLCCELLLTFGITHASGKSVLQRAAMAEMKQWKEDNVAPRPSISNQLKALDVSYLCNSTIFPSISEVYELDTVAPQEVVLFVNEKLTRKRTKYLKHMAYIISQLKLQEYFDTSEMLLPLLGMDKLMTIEAYLSDKDITATFVKRLDDLLEPSGELLAELVSHLELEFNYKIDTANFKFVPDQLTTLIKRLAKVQKLDSAVAPNLAVTKTVSNLKSLLFCKYKKGHNEDWTSTLVTSVQGNKILMKALFKEIAMYGDLEYAAVLYQQLKPDLNLLDPKLQKLIVHKKSSQPAEGSSRQAVVPDNVSAQEKVDDSASTTESPQLTPDDQVKTEIIPKDPVSENGFAALPAGVSIFDVASVASLKVCQDVLSSAEVIGYDSEWRALLDPTKPSPVALVQLATHDTCFLLDVSAVLECCSDAVLCEFADAVFSDSVTVVGYALGQDITKLTETNPILGGKFSNHSRTVDLSIAHKHLTKSERLKRSQLIREFIREGKPLPNSDNVSKETGLARLCEMLFSCPLNKTYQVSDWSRRPLLPDQRIYAALDAYILLPLFYNLQQHFHPTPLQELTLVVAEIAEEYKHVSYIAAYSHPTPVNLLRVVVDTPCQGLGKKLRHIGIDCVILEDKQTVDDAAKISLTQGRIILSRDGNCEKLRKLTDPGRVFKVEGKNATDQLAEIRQHFNLVVKEEDLFSRCAICNSPYFLKVDPEKAKALKLAQEVYNSSTVEEQYEVYDRRVTRVETISVTTDGLTQYGVRLQLDKVKIDKFSETKTFWGCYDCGKMYWDGCHIKNFKDKHNL